MGVVETIKDIILMSDMDSSYSEALCLCNTHKGSRSARRSLPLITNYVNPTPLLTVLL